MGSYQLSGIQQLREAQEWSRILPTADEMQRRQFAAWVMASVGNLNAFLLNTALETEIGSADASVFPRIK